MIILLKITHFGSRRSHLYFPGIRPYKNKSFFIYALRKDGWLRRHGIGIFIFNAQKTNATKL